MSRQYDPESRKKNDQSMLTIPQVCSRCKKKTVDMISDFDFCRKCTSSKEVEYHALSFLTKEMRGLSIDEKVQIIKDLTKKKKEEIKNVPASSRNV